MTTNQLQYQRNLIAEDEAAIKARQAEIAAQEAATALAQQQEQARHNVAQEQINVQELLQNLQIAQGKLEQAERENAARYGYAAYMAPGEERGNAREVFNMIPNALSVLLSPITSIASLFKR